jgi:cysteine synthase
MRTQGEPMSEYIAEDLTELIGKTPLLNASRFAKATGVPDTTDFIVKLECFNPSASVKDRPALWIVEAAERSGELRPGGTIVEATSGNMGIGLAAVAVAKGYKMIVTMPESMSVERRKLIAQLGAKLELTSGDGGMNGAIARAEAIVAETDNAIAAHQFVNPVNVEAHYHTTGPEIWEDTEGKVDIFVAGVGTGGTLTGTGRFLRERNARIELYAVEPDESAVLSHEPSGVHGIQGIGPGFVSEITDTTLLSDIVRVNTNDAIEAARLFGRTEGALVGISSGAALAAAVRVAKRPDSAGKTLVVLLPDTAERYLSTPLFA